MRLLIGFLTVCVLLGGVLVWRLSPGLSELATAPARGPVDAAAPAAVAAPARIVSAEPPTVERQAAVIPSDGYTPSSPDASNPDSVRWADDALGRAARRQLTAARLALDDDPHSIAALRDALAALQVLERWDEASDVLKHLIELQPDDVEVRFELGAVCLRTRRWIEAIAAFGFVVEQQPRRGEAWFNLAVAHQAARHLADAQRAWDQAVALLPQRIDARAARGEVLLDLHEWAAAEADFRALLVTEPDNASAALNLALAIEQQQRKPDAAAMLDEVLRRCPNDVRLLNRAAALSLELAGGGATDHAARRTAAIAYWQRSLAVQPQQDDIQRLLDAAVGPQGQ